jgi:hypothetical protein
LSGGARGINKGKDEDEDKDKDEDNDEKYIEVLALSLSPVSLPLSLLSINEPLYSPPSKLNEGNWRERIVDCRERGML